MGPQVPQSFNINCGKGHRKNAVGRENATMCNVPFSVSTQGLPFLAHSTLFPLSDAKEPPKSIFLLWKKVVIRWSQS